MILLGSVKHRLAVVRIRAGVEQPFDLDEVVCHRGVVERRQDGFSHACSYAPPATATMVNITSTSSFTRTVPPAAVTGRIPNSLWRTVVSAVAVMRLPSDRKSTRLNSSH